MRRVLAAVAVLVFTLGAAVVVDATPAAASFSSCPAGQACVYTDAYGGGAQGAIPFSGFGDGQCHNLSAPFDRAISSVIVQYGNGWGLRLYPAPNCFNSLLTIPHNTHIDNLADVKTGLFGSWNDVASSFRIVQA